MHARPFSGGWFCLHPDFHVIPKIIKEAEEAVGGKTAQKASGKG